MGRAIVREPKAFLMDEPLSNLDAKLRVEMRAAVSRLQQRLGTTTVYVTHDQTEAMTLGDRVAVMRAGILQQFDTPRELYDNPQQPLRRRLHRLAVHELLRRRTSRATRVRTPLGDLPARTTSCAAAWSARGGLRARSSSACARRSSRTPSSPPSARTAATFEAPIEIVESMGSEIYAYFAFEGGDLEVDELQELEADSGASEARGSGRAHAPSRALDADERRPAGPEARAPLDRHDQAAPLRPAHGRVADARPRARARQAAAGTPA